MITKNKIGQIFEVSTPVQGYLMDKTFVSFNITVSPLVSLSNPIHFFQPISLLLNLRSSPRPTVKLRKKLDWSHYLNLEKGTVITINSYILGVHVSYFSELLWGTGSTWWDTLIVRLQNHTKVPVHLFIITDKSRGKGNTKIGVSVLLRDEEVTLENEKSSDTPVCTETRDIRLLLFIIKW